MPAEDYDVIVSTDFEGANPQTPTGVLREGGYAFLIVPAQEEDNPNYKFRLDTLVVNRAAAPRRVTLHIDWRDLTYMEPRHHVFIRSGDAWQRVPGKVEGTFVTVEFDAPAGETWVSLNPKYSYSDHLADLERLRAHAAFTIESFGKTQQERDLFVLRAGQVERPVVLIEAGNHPYETSGAYCIDGMLRWLLGAGSEWLQKVAMSFVPMSNPDGVAGGWCRLTGPGGVDVTHECGLSSDPTCVALRGLYERLRPDVYVNIHGWMYNDLDNFRYEDREAARYFLPCLLGDVGGPVWRWRIQNSNPEVPAVTNTWHVREKYGTRTLGFDIAWNRRTEEDMRAVGALLLEAACRAAVELPPAGHAGA